MAGRLAKDGGQPIDAPDNPEAMAEIEAVLKGLPAKTEAAVLSDLFSSSSKSFALTDRVTLIDDLHDVYFLPPDGKPPCWVIVINGYTDLPVAAGLCKEKPSDEVAAIMARRVL